MNAICLPCADVTYASCSRVTWVHGGNQPDVRCVDCEQLMRPGQQYRKTLGGKNASRADHLQFIKATT